MGQGGWDWDLGSVCNYSLHTRVYECFVLEDVPKLPPDKSSDKTFDISLIREPRYRDKTSRAAPPLQL